MCLAKVLVPFRSIVVVKTTPYDVVIKDNKTRVSCWSYRLDRLPIEYPYKLTWIEDWMFIYIDYYANNCF